MSFLQAEKRRQTEWKLSTRHLSREARKPGLFNRKLYPFCLPVDCSHENLFESIREHTVSYFKANSISWHSAALPDAPSNHLCGSQVFLVNLLAPFQYHREALSVFLTPALPDIATILPIEQEDQYLAFEWVPPEDLLCELKNASRRKKLKRGVGNTSLDFAFLYRSTTGRTTMVLGEAKYTEHYPKTPATPYVVSKRLSGYFPLLRESGWEIPDLESNLPALATEPVYQLFRHHLMALRLRQSYGTKLDVVRLLHVYVARSPGEVSEAIASPVLKPHNGIELLSRSPIPFSEASAQSLLAAFPLDRYPDFTPWHAYITERYRILPS